VLLRGVHDADQSRTGKREVIDNMALCSLGRNGKPEYYYYYKHSKTDRQELSNQSHRKMRNYNKELIRQELNDYMNEAV